MVSRAKAHVLPLSLGVFLAACSGAIVEKRPEAALSESTPAQASFDDVRDAWLHERSPRSAELRDMLVSFLVKHPKDGLAPLAHAYLAVTLMDQDAYPLADAELGKTELTPQGSARDFINVVRARSLRHSGQPEYALELLRPLVGKIIDPVEREVFLEEISLAAIDAKLSYEALAYMDAWLRGVTEDQRDRVRVKVKTALATLPREVVETTYRVIRARGATSSYSRELSHIIARRLGEIAVEANDPQLARWLVEPENGGTAFASEDLPPELGDLATSRRGIKTVYGKIVGLLLSSTTNEARDHSAEVARGVAWALGLPRASGADPTDVRLVTRSDGGDTIRAELALEELTGEGVSVVIAGVDGPSADRAQKYCEAHHVPLLLLYPGSEDPEDPTLLLGVGRGDDLPQLASALTNEGLAKVALVTNAEGERALEVGAIETQGMISLAHVTGCDVLPVQAGEPRFPIGAWRDAALRGFIVSGPGACARDVVSESRVFYNKEPTFAFTLDASESAQAVQKLIAGSHARVISLQAGIFPVLTDKIESLGDADLVKYVGAFGVRPSWWASIGRDAGLIARGAVSPLPEDGTSDSRGVAQRRALVQAGLIATRAHLWTTQSPGFSAGSRTLPRAFKIVSWPK